MATIRLFFFICFLGTAVMPFMATDTFAGAPKRPELFRGLSPYELLDVSPDAEPKVLKMAYRSLAKRVHPDTGGSGDKFTEASSAYEWVSDAQLRTVYDSWLKQNYPEKLKPREKTRTEILTSTILEIQSELEKARDKSLLNARRLISSYLQNRDYELDLSLLEELIGLSTTPNTSLTLSYLISFVEEYANPYLDEDMQRRARNIISNLQTESVAHEGKESHSKCEKSLNQNSLTFEVFQFTDMYGRKWTLPFIP